MSGEDAEDGGIIRTVTAPYRSRMDTEMSIISLLYGLGLLMVVIPLLPFIAIIWLLGQLGQGATE